MELAKFVADKIDQKLKMYIVKHHVDSDGDEDLTKTLVMEFTIGASVERDTALDNNVLVISFIGSRYKTIEDVVNRLLMFNSRAVEISSKIYEIMDKNRDYIRVCSKKIDELDEIASSMNQRMIKTVIGDLIELKQKIAKKAEIAVLSNSLLLEKVNQMDNARVVNERTMNYLKEATKDYKLCLNHLSVQSHMES